MKSIQVNAEARCPACLKSLDGATQVYGDASPEPGDLSVCLYCSMGSVFNTDMTLRAIRPDEFATFSPAVRSQLQFVRLNVLAFDALQKKGDASGVNP